jgi:hypothetical protein
MIHLAERFAEAVRLLTSDGPVKVRLARAFGEQLEARRSTPTIFRSRCARISGGCEPR